jgi:hypothetical protein
MDPDNLGDLCSNANVLSDTLSATGLGDTVQFLGNALVVLETLHKKSDYCQRVQFILRRKFINAKNNASLIDMGAIMMFEKPSFMKCK